VVTHRAGTFPPFSRSGYDQSLRRAQNLRVRWSRSPGAKERRGPPLFGLAPCGVCPAAAIADGAVRFYRTFSPLPRLTTSTHSRPCRGAAF